MMCYLWMHGNRWVKYIYPIRVCNFFNNRLFWAVLTHEFVGFFINKEKVTVGTECDYKWWSDYCTEQKRDPRYTVELYDMSRHTVTLADILSR